MFGEGLSFQVGRQDLAPPPSSHGSDHLDVYMRNSTVSATHSCGPRDLHMSMRWDQTSRWQQPGRSQTHMEPESLIMLRARYSLKPLKNTYPKNHCTSFQQCSWASVGLTAAGASLLKFLCIGTASWNLLCAHPVAYSEGERTTSAEPDFITVKFCKGRTCQKTLSNQTTPWWD